MHTTDNTKPHKASFVFYTSEGRCESPNGSEVENFQILGFVSGENREVALAKLLAENPWIIGSGYEIAEILSKELLGI